jgi:hypothetical protein
MRLFTFAHFKEAEAFVNHFQFKSIPFIFDHVFQNSDGDYLLITGEGLQSTTEKLSAFLGSMNQSVKQIINLGISGSLSADITTGEIYLIRTCYSKPTQESIEFKSFTTNHYITPIDCISVNQRIFDKKQRTELSAFAKIVDRELFAIGSVSHLFKIPFYSIKYISDDLESSDFCKTVTEEAPLFSNALLSFYLKLELEKLNHTHIQKSAGTPTLFSNSLYYFTVTQKRQFQNLLEKMLALQIDFESFHQSKEIKELESLEISSKERTKKFIEQMSYKINPLQKQIDQEIQKALSTIKIRNIEIGYDKNLEDNFLNIHFQIRSQKELEEKISILRNFTFEKYNRIFQGLIGSEDV